MGGWSVRPVRMRFWCIQAFLQLGLRSDLRQYLLDQVTRESDASRACLRIVGGAGKLIDLRAYGLLEGPGIKIRPRQYKFGNGQAQQVEECGHRKAACLGEEALGPAACI